MKLKIAGAALVAAVLLTGCADASDPESMNVRCIGADKVFIVEAEGSDRAALFVLPAHPECKPGGVVTR